MGMASAAPPHMTANADSSFRSAAYDIDDHRSCVLVVFLCMDVLLTSVIVARVPCVCVCARAHVSSRVPFCKTFRTLPLAKVCRCLSSRVHALSAFFPAGCCWGERTYACAHMRHVSIQECNLSFWSEVDPNRVCNLSPPLFLKLCVSISRSPDTEIDWIAYMQEVEGVHSLFLCVCL